jgi:hypothetical protein
MEESGETDRFRIPRVASMSSWPIYETEGNYGRVETSITVLRKARNQP